MLITYTPQTGKLKGLIHLPYKDKDGFYVVSPDRFAVSYIRVKTLDEAYEYLTKGLKIRMKHGSTGSSLIKSSSLDIK